MMGSGNGRPVVHPRRVVQFGIVVGFETPTVIKLAFWTGLADCFGQSHRSGAI
jgi:hypothetical protein